MGPYDLKVTPSVAQDLRGVRPDAVRRILQRIEALRDTPRPHGCRKLSTHERYRIRAGDYRILYTVSDAPPVVVVVKVGHRRDVYRES
jgi:mRNA interferase RelE/StbE